MYDAIIVGARCAGSSLALLLARQGHRVLLVDRATFPSDTISGHMIWYRGVMRLKKWGLLDKVIASGCPPLQRISSHYGDFMLTSPMPFVDDVPVAIGPRRTVLDAMLLNEAAEAGAEVREGFSVTDLLTDGDRVVGIRGQGKDGVVVNERAHIVVGADGKNSRIAQLVNAPMYKEVPSITAWYLTYWSNLPCEGLEVHCRNQRAFFVFPTNDGLTMAALGIPHEEFQTFRGDIEGDYLQAARMMPMLAERMEGAKRAERFVGMADVPNFLRKPYGAGWALVGDAGHHKDPTPAFGISDAFCDAELLVDAIHAGLVGEQSFDEALALYEQKRHMHAIPEHEYTCKVARVHMHTPPEVLGLRAALRHNPADTHAYFSAIATVIPSEQFYAPANLGRIMQQAQLTPIPL
jgi:flavin-dependent dehydrogenase